MATAIPVLVLCRRFERNYHEVVRRIQDQTGDLTTAIEEDAKGIRVIKAFGRSEEMFERYDAQCRDLRDTQLERVRVHTRFIWVLVLDPEPHARGGAARRRDGRRCRMQPSPSAASSRSSPTC